MRPYYIVFGNEKGGTGKSTLAMHVAVYLLNAGFTVGTIDTDARQGTFSRYFENRNRSNYDLSLPKHFSVQKSMMENKKEAEKVDYDNLISAFSNLSNCDFIVIDTPGNDTYLSRIAHSYANTLITPLNDSFVDLDVLVKIDDDKMNILRPSIYAEMVWEQRKERAKRGDNAIDWIVVRNRLTTLYTKNKRDIRLILEALAKRIGFRLGDGFCERVIFKELFLSGLTLLDFEKINQPLQLSHVAARQELRDLIALMKLPKNVS